MIRKLGTFERAAVISNEYAPFNVIIVLRLGNAPSPETLRMALDQLQDRHRLLRARITRVKNTLWFEQDEDGHAIPLTLLDWRDETAWENIAQKEMGIGFNIEHPPLLRVSYVQKGNSGDIILSAHHAIIDGSSGNHLAEELVTLCAGLELETPVSEITNPSKKMLPPSHWGPRRLINLIVFSYSQLVGEIKYWLKNMGKRKPQVNPGGKGRIFSMTISEALVEQLTRQCRKNKITLNSLLNATQTLAVNRILYNGEKVCMATYTFADLRPFLNEPIPPQQLGSWVTLMRIFLDVSGKMDVWQLANNLHHQIYKSFKRGDKFNAFLTSETLLKLLTSFKSVRFGSTALNYSGVIPLKKYYGEIKLNGVHAFISGFDLAPEFSSQARLRDDKIIIDSIYLDTDMDRPTANRIHDEIQFILQKAVSSAG